MYGVQNSISILGLMVLIVLVIVPAVRGTHVNLT